MKPTKELLATDSGKQGKFRNGWFYWNEFVASNEFALSLRGVQVAQGPLVVCGYWLLNTPGFLPSARVVTFPCGVAGDHVFWYHAP